MTWETVFRTDRFSVGIGVQSTDLLTEEAVDEWVFCDMPQVTYRTVQSQVARSSQSAGAFEGPLPGSDIPVLAIKFPWRGQLSAYDHTTDTPAPRGLARALPMWSVDAIAKQTNGVSPSDGNTITLNTSTGKVGCLVASLDDDDQRVKMGFIKSLSGAGPYTANLFEDLDAQPDTNAERIPTYTWYPKGELEHYGCTIRIVGESTEHDRRFIGFVPETAKFMVEDDVLMCQIEGPCYGGESELYAGGGGLQALTAILDMDAIRGTSRYVFGARVGSSTSVFDINDGTADPYGSYDIRNVEWTLTWAHHVLMSPAATQGIVDVTVSSPVMDVSFAVPDIEEYAKIIDVATRPILVGAWENRTALSMSAYYGREAGKLLAINMPAGRLTGKPELAEIDGVRYWQGTLRSGYYSGDGSSSNGGNKAWRMGAG